MEPEAQTDPAGACAPQPTQDFLFRGKILELITIKIACARIHVERAIGRIKCYQILDFTRFCSPGEPSKPNHREMEESMENAANLATEM